MDPGQFWEAVCCCTQAIAKNLDGPVRALCLSSHGETFVPVNEKNEAIARAILNQDSRALDETAWIERHFGRKRLFEITGLVAHPMYPIPKILWMRRHQPETYASAAKFVTAIGYILLRLGLAAYVDYSLASRYLAFDVRKHCWSQEVLEAVDLDSDRLPEAAPAGTIAGKLNAAAAGRLKLPSGTPVILGGHDQPCGALGVGIIAPGRAANSMGTYECLLAASNQPILTDAALASSLNSYCHVVPERYITIAFFPAGIMMKWFHDLLYSSVGAQIRGSGEQSEVEHYAFLEAHAPGGPTGLCITPNLIGTCNPDFDPNARGIMYGLDPSTGPPAIYKGILEGLACELSQVTGLLADAVSEFRDICVTGGGTRSPLGLILRAALTGKYLHVMRCPEAVCLGGAILAGVAVGEYGSIDEAVKRVVHEVAVVAPDQEIASAYEQQLKQYQWLRSLKPPAAN
jgi:xylulokinase